MDGATELKRLRPKAAARRHLKMEVRVAMQNTDASTAAAKTATMMDLDAATICYPHVLRAVGHRKQRGKIKGTQDQKDDFIEIAKEDVSNMHMCATYSQMVSLMNLTMKDWRKVQKPKQAAMAAWFEKSHCDVASRAFYVRASGFDWPLMDSNANNIEAMHSKLSSVKGVVMRSSLANVLTQTLPAICKWAGLTLAARGWALQPDHVPAEMLAKVRAREELDMRKPQVFVTHDEKKHFMLSSSYMAKHPQVSSTLLVGESSTSWEQGEGGEGVGGG